MLVKHSKNPPVDSNTPCFMGSRLFYEKLMWFFLFALNFHKCWELGSLILSFFKLLLFLQFSFTFLRSQLLTSSPSHTQGSNCPEFCVNHSLTFIFNFTIYSYIINNNLVLLVFELQIKKSYQRVYCAPRLPGFLFFFFFF